MRFRLLLVTLLAVGAVVPAAAQASEQGAARHLQAVKGDTAALGQFLRAMPKGTDLHTHLSGAVYAESIVKWGAADGQCIDTSTLFSSFPPCVTGQVPLSQALTDQALYQRILGSWSMRGFTPSGTESGHDHFFNTFDQLSSAFSAHKGDGVAEVAQRAAVQHVQYVEPLITPQFGATSRAAAKVPFTRDYAALRDQLLAAGLRDAIPAASRDIDNTLAQERTALGCDTAKPLAGCRTRVGFDVQVLRGQSPVVVFAQLLFGYELMAADHRWVGMNMVQPEDGPIALRDYQLQMRMIAFLRTLYPQAHLTLHAGELAPGSAPPADLRFHVREAVNVAKADRIGHGVDIRGERDPAGTLRTMARRGVCIEINLTSNRQILGVSGKAHPLRTYLKSGVPVTLSTDDEAVERTDLTEQYVIAAQEQGMTYRQLKRAAENGLRCSFLPAAEKRAAQREQGAMFRAFERRWP